MVRIAGLKRRQTTGLSVRSPDGLTIREQLERVTRRTQDLVQRHADVFIKDVTPQLEEAGIRIIHWPQLGDDDARRLREYSVTRCSRCSPRWRWTRRTRSPTSAACP